MRLEINKSAAWVQLKELGVEILTPAMQVGRALGSAFSVTGHHDVSKFLGIARIAMTDSTMAGAVKSEEVVRIAQAAMSQPPLFIECMQFAKAYPQFWARFVNENSLVGQAFEHVQYRDDKAAYIQLGNFALSEAELSRRFASEWFPQYIGNLLVKNKFEQLLAGSVNGRDET